MSVYRRGGSWAVLVDTGVGSDGRRRRHYEGGFTTKREARAAEVRAKNQLAERTFVDRSSMTLTSYLSDWLRTQRDLKPSTRQGYEQNIRNHVIPALGAIRLQELTTTDLSRLQSDLLETGSVKVGRSQGGPLSPSTVRQIMTILRKALQDALRAGLVVRNVADAAQKPKARRGAGLAIQTWTAPQLRRFLAETESDRLHALWVTAAMTGLRRGEVVGLQWDDVDLARSVASVRRTLVFVKGQLIEGTPKTWAGRQIALAPEAVAALGTWRKSQLEERLAWGEAWSNTGYVFTREDGTPLHPDRVTDAFRRIAQTLDLPRIRLHDLRHTWATLALETGVPLKVVSENLGHSSIRITADTYQHVTPSMASNAVELVARAVFDRPGSTSGIR